MKVKMTNAANIVLRSLGPDDQKRVSAWIDNLKNWENDEFVRNNSHAVGTVETPEGPEIYYVLKTSSDVRLFFTLNNEDKLIKVEDIARKDTILRTGHLGHKEKEDVVEGA